MILDIYEQTYRNNDVESHLGKIGAVLSMEKRINMKDWSKSTRKDQ